ncbi:MAG: hypothetical protein ABI247_11310 [Rhodanobacter sp.]
MTQATIASIRQSATTVINLARTERVARGSFLGVGISTLFIDICSRNGGQPIGKRPAHPNKRIGGTEGAASDFDSGVARQNC